MSAQWAFEHRRDERTSQHLIENSDLIYWSLMMLIRSTAQIQERRSTRTLNSYWMKFFDERQAQRKWSFFETRFTKIDLFRDSANIFRKIKIEFRSEFRFMIKTTRSFEADSLKQMKKQKNWMNESQKFIRNTHRLKQKEEDCERFHSIRIICLFHMCFDNTY